MPRSPALKSTYDFMLPRRYSKRTIEAYLYWIKAFIYLQDKLTRLPTAHEEELQQLLPYRWQASL